MVPPKRNGLDEFERRQNRRIEIESTETNSALAKCNPQDSSPLFTHLPREIRDLVWAYATAPFEDEENTYANNEYFYRPGHTARLKTDTNLLLTCRRIWLEANAFPMLQAEHCFWYYRAAPDGRNKEWMEGLTDLNRVNLGKLHLFAQMFAIEGLGKHRKGLRNYFLREKMVVDDFQPRELHVTIRHTDWWFWENDTPLRLKDSWVEALLNTPDLRRTETLTLELETLASKVDQLLPIVERLEQLESEEYETHIVDGVPVTTKFLRQEGREISKWSGPVTLDNGDFWPYKGLERLDYHVITLTWKLKFPQLPRAHVPTLRCAPSIFQTLTPPNPSSRKQEYATVIPDAKTIRNQFHTAPPFPRRPMRRRDYKKLRAGFWPPRLEQPLADMRNAEEEVRMMSKCHAMSQEAVREAQFVDGMTPVVFAAYTRVCEEGKTLLRFAE